MATLVLGFVEIQDLTYTEKQLGLGVTVSYTNGGTAGSEVVTVSGHAITVQIGATSTATQIKAAVEAHVATATSRAASELVTVAITGTGSNVQLTCKSATLAGGVAAAKASLTIGECMKLTADATGTGGNSIRFRFTSGGTAGSEVVSVSTNDISVQIEEGVSTFEQVKAAIDAEGAAAALVDVSFVSGSGQVALVAMAPSYTALTGGLSAVAASVIVQDLTIAADATGTAANGKTFTFTTGATAGAEVVTVTSGNINVQIENGVSTATQIETALNAAAPFTSVYNVTVSGMGATAQKTVNGASMAGEVGVGSDSFYLDETVEALTASFVYFPFNFLANHLDIANREAAGSNQVIWSFDGVNIHGVLEPGETWSLELLSKNGIFLKYGTGTPDYTLFAN